MLVFSSMISFFVAFWCLWASGSEAYEAFRLWRDPGMSNDMAWVENAMRSGWNLCAAIAIALLIFGRPA